MANNCVRVRPAIAMAAGLIVVLAAANAAATENPPTELWNVTFSAGGESRASGVATGPDGNHVVAGQSCPISSISLDCGFRTIKYDAATGNVLWNVTFDSGGGRFDGGSDVAIGADGHAVVAGNSCSPSDTMCEYRVIKYDGDTGAVIWNVTFSSGRGDDLATGISIGPDGQPVISGHSCDVNTSHCDFQTTKLDAATGAVIWNVVFNNPTEEDEAFAVSVGPDGHAVVTGYSCDPSFTTCEFRTIKYNGATGSIIWNVVFSSPDSGFFTAAHNVSVGTDDNAVIAGSDCGATGCHPRAIKYDGATGVILWNVSLATNDAGQGHGVKVGQDGHIVMSGQSCGAGCNFETTKFDGTSGSVLWDVISSGSRPFNFSLGATVGLDGNPVITGFTCDGTSGQPCDFQTIKYLLHQATPSGTNVAVALNGGSGPDGATLTFDNVIIAGSTSLVTSSSGPAAPAGFAFIGAPPTYYDITTTAIATPTIEVCLNYSTRAFAPPESDLRLMHFEGLSWVDRTTSLDTISKIICGRVDSLSPFGIAQAAKVLTSLGPANIWIGLKNSDDVGIRFDLRAEVYRNVTQLVGSGQVGSVAGGSSGFNNAHQDTIALIPRGQVGFPSGSTLSIQFFVRNACSGSGKNAGAARLWYDDAAANSRFDATVDVPATYYLRGGSVLSITAGSGPKKTIDVAAGSKCSPFKPFDIWTITIP